MSIVNVDRTMELLAAAMVFAFLLRTAISAGLEGTVCCRPSNTLTVCADKNILQLTPFPPSRVCGRRLAGRAERTSFLQRITPNIGLPSVAHRQLPVVEGERLSARVLPRDRGMQRRCGMRCRRGPRLRQLRLLLQPRGRLRTQRCCEVFLHH